MNVWESKWEIWNVYWQMLVTHNKWLTICKQCHFWYDEDSYLMIGVEFSNEACGFKVKIPTECGETEKLGFINESKMSQSKSESTAKQ